jgi:hypothetical protein
VTVVLGRHSSMWWSCITCHRSHRQGMFEVWDICLKIMHSTLTCSFCLHNEKKKARDQNAAVAAAAGIRLLLEKGSRASKDANGKGISEATSVALSLAPKVDLILGMDLATTHPFVRVELARCLSLATPLLVDWLVCQNSVEGKGGGGGGDEASFEDSSQGAAEGSESEATAIAMANCSLLTIDIHNKRDSRTKCTRAVKVLSSKLGVEYISFLFASEHDNLHQHALMALSSLTEFVMDTNNKMELKGDGGAKCDIPLYCGATVTDKPLLERLEEILRKRSPLNFTDMKALIKKSSKYHTTSS